MSTGNSPLSKLKREAENMARILKMADRGERIAKDPLGKIAASKASGVFAIGLMIDDKVVRVDIPWRTIHSFSEVALAEWILKLMRNKQTEH